MGVGRKKAAVATGDSDFGGEYVARALYILFSEQWGRRKIFIKYFLHVLVKARSFGN